MAVRRRERRTSLPHARPRLTGPISPALILAVCTGAALFEEKDSVPTVFTTETDFQNQTHFLVFLGNDKAGEDAPTATAYYNAIDPPDPITKKGAS